MGPSQQVEVTTRGSDVFSVLFVGSNADELTAVDVSRIPDEKVRRSMAADLREHWAVRRMEGTFFFRCSSPF